MNEGGDVVGKAGERFRGEIKKKGRWLVFIEWVGGGNMGGREGTAWRGRDNTSILKGKEREQGREGGREEGR